MENNPAEGLNAGDFNGKTIDRWKQLKVTSFMQNRLLFKLATISMVCNLSLVALQSQAADKNIVNATATYGLDDNPHQLSAENKPDEAINFLKGDFKLAANLFEILDVKAQVTKTQYDDDPRADRYTGSAELRLKDQFAIGEANFKYQIAADYQFEDKTYVNKRTGFVGVFAGESIADRYDYDQQTYFAELIYMQNSIFEYGASYQQRSKSFEELEIPGLSNLDYDHQKFTAGFEYKASDLGRFFMNGSFTQREYLDRRGRDLETSLEVLGTDLFYNYATLNLGYIYRPNQDTRWRYTYNYEERRDTVTGYYNATGGFLGISAVHRISDYQFLSAGVKYLKFSLVNQVESQVDPNATPDTFEDDQRERQGATINLGYEWILATLYETNLAVYVELEHSNFEHIDDFYTHEKSSASLGIRWSAF